MNFDTEGQMATQPISQHKQQLPSRLPLNLYPCGDLGYLAVPELLLSQSVASYGQGVKMALYR